MGHLKAGVVLTPVGSLASQELNVLSCRVIVLVSCGYHSKQAFLEFEGGIDLLVLVMRLIAFMVVHIISLYDIGTKVFK